MICETTIAFCYSKPLELVDEIMTHFLYFQKDNRQ